MHFSRSILSLLVLAAGAGSVVAADLPRRPVPTVFAPLPSFTWTGFYVGASGGGLVGGEVRSETSFFADNSRFRVRNVEGGFIGGQIGYNAQIGSIVVGLEGDAQAAFASGRRSVTTESSFGGPFFSSSFRSTERLTADVEFLASARGRLGYAIDRVLVYGTGGVSFAGVELRERDTFATTLTFLGTTSTNVQTFNANASKMLIGYVAGAGVEYAITDNVSVKGEYLYYGLGKEVFRPITSSADLDFHTAKLGVNYRF